ncbi:hypothetical protein HYC85_006444 [Camellia sinensis]|uniref:Leucine-rich repeat-containing N-terminal plant-type domain-containing protein n=1 Tax=Camellia sinensis TaxID=4442 RepID=A0A7J7HNL0_CAMSI|nr:hypothetical protein HYC85_006444 [Camellia sinensis]
MRIIFITWLFSIAILTILCIRTIPVYSQCLEDQKSLLVNWTPSNDYCGWKGVTCDQAGHVTGLDLNSEFISGGIDQSSSLFSLRFLESLNLADNSFNWKQIPSSFGYLTSLKYLNLANAVTATSEPKFNNPSSESHGLTELRLDGVNISAPGMDWGQAISSSLTNLRVLSLSNCYLSGPIDSSLLKLQSLSEIHLVSNNLSLPVPEFFVNFTNLIALSLSDSNSYGRFPEKIFQVPTLQTLQLSNNIKLQGSLPEFLQNGSLQRIVLRSTNFSVRLPDSTGN